MGKKWLLTRTTPEVLIDLLSDRITIREAFLKDNSVRFSINLIHDQYYIGKNNLDDWNAKDSTDLPDEGELLEAEEGEYSELIKYYQTMLSKQ